MGCYVANESNRIIVRHREVSDTAWPYWTHDRLINPLVSKLRRLIPVRGRQRTRRGVRQVSHEVARLYWEPQATGFIQMVANGTVAIDFDARAMNGRGLRNHGTEFRIALDDLPRLDNHHQRFDHK